MPIVTYTTNKTLPSAPAAVPSVRMTAAPNASNLAADLPKDPWAGALAQTAADVQAIGNDMKREENQTATASADAVFTDRINQAMTANLQRKGVNAMGAGSDMGADIVGLTTGWLPSTQLRRSIKGSIAAENGAPAAAAVFGAPQKD